MSTEDEALELARGWTAKPLPTQKITPRGIKLVALALIAARDDLERNENRLRTQVEAQQHWRERAIAAEQALGLYGSAADARALETV